MKKYILHILIWFISLYLSFSSFILVKIITNDIILNSYKAYSYAKINWNVIVEKTTSALDKWKLLWSKFRHKDEYAKLEKEYKLKEESKKKEQDELKNELEFNQKVLTGLPYILAIIIFIFTYTKTLEKTKELLSYFPKNKTN